MNYSSIILPTDVRQQYLLCYLKYYLEHCEGKTFTSNEIAESLLGKLVKDKYDVDIFILDKYPKSVRPFYTKKCNKDDRFTNSYDIILRGIEILSGAQRIHSYQELCESLKEKNIDLDEIKGYLETFKYATYPHGGGGFGLERFAMTLFNIPSIKQCSLFPRDPVHLSP